MNLSFSKYQATGNDFIIMECLSPGASLLNVSMIEKMCNRHFGIGADGLILAGKNEKGMLQMSYYNSDGRPGSFCGNGGRAFIKYLFDKGKIPENTWLEFMAFDGLHRARVKNSHPVMIDLEMKDVRHIEKYENAYLLDTGSPHYVCRVRDIHHLDVMKEGKKIRNSPPFIENGINVNFFSEDEKEGVLYLKTYERGVEAMTLSCGTGTVATALVWAMEKKIPEGKIKVRVPGGELEVTFTRTGEHHFSQILLSGPAEKTFEGVYELPNH